MIRFKMIDPRMTEDDLGFLPHFFSQADLRPAKEQLNENYAHGGGWHPYGEGKWKLDLVTHKLHYPGDPPMKVLAEAKLRDELILFYNYAIVAIVQPDGSFEVARID